MPKLPIRLLAVLSSLLLAAPAQGAIPATERTVLVNLYNGTGGPGWTNGAGWNGAAGTECGWYGITCDDSSSHVVRILLSSNSLTGTLPAITDLTALAVFDVNTNGLAGPLPSLSGLTQLTDFNASSNQLSGSLPPSRTSRAS